MPDPITININGVSVVVPRHATVAVAISIAGQACRISVNGEPRSPLCAIGICYECRATVNGRPHSRTCQILCEEGMDVRTDG